MDEEKKNKTIDYFVYLLLKYSKNMVFLAIWKDYNSFIFVCLFGGRGCFETRIAVSQSELIMWPKITLTSDSSCLYLPDTVFAGMHHHTQLYASSFLS